MKAILFSGPTLRPCDCPADLASAFDWRPPARRGDIFRAARNGATIIGLIDGYFRDVPAPSHQEILWAQSHGCIVAGAGSMGALRAAELWPFGMIGVGRVFRDYQSGAIECDDAVAVEHGPAGTNYVQTSEALVDICYTLAEAVRLGIMGADIAAQCCEAASELHYSKRTLSSVISKAEKKCTIRIPSRTRQWLSENKQSVKRKDALDLLEYLAILPEQAERPPQSDTGFIETIYFREFRELEENPFLRDRIYIPHS